MTRSARGGAERLDVALLHVPPRRVPIFPSREHRRDSLLHLATFQRGLQVPRAVRRLGVRRGHDSELGPLAVARLRKGIHEVRKARGMVEVRVREGEQARARFVVVEELPREALPTRSTAIHDYPRAIWRMHHDRLARARSEHEDRQRVIPKRR